MHAGGARIQEAPEVVDLDVVVAEIARRRVRIEREFVTHRFIYIAANAMFVGIWAATGRGYPSRRRRRVSQG